MNYNQEQKYFKFYKDNKEDDNDFSFDDDFKDDDFQFEEDKTSKQEDIPNTQDKGEEVVSDKNQTEDTVKNPVSDFSEEKNSKENDFDENEYEEYQASQNVDSKKKDSPIGLTILVIVLFLFFLLGGYFTYTYFFSSDKESIETLVEEPEPVQPKPVEPVEPEPEEPEPEEYKVQYIKERTGNAHIIVSSSVDGDLAKDFADSLISKGYKCSIIYPFPTKLRYRVTIASFPTVEDAVNELERYRNDLDPKAWVLKY